MSSLPPLTKERVQRAVDAVLATLGTPKTELHQHAMDAFEREDYLAIKRLASTHLGDSFCRSLGYLGSAYKLTPNTDTILAEAARAAADFAHERELERLSEAIAQALN